MPEGKTIERSKRDKAEGKAPSTQAGEFIREEIHHIREGKHGARSPQQAIAIGLSEARRAGVALPPPRKGSAQLRHKAKLDLAKGRRPAGRRRTSSRRSRATLRALRREGHSAASRRSLSRQATSSAHRRSATERSAAAKRAARTRARAAFLQRRSMTSVLLRGTRTNSSATSKKSRDGSGKRSRKS
jgi:hypothetical protein